MMDLKNYIEHVYCLEKSCYMQKALVQGLQVQLRKASKPTFHAIKETSSSKGGDILGGIIAMLFCAVVGGLIGLGICFVVAIVEMIASMVRIFLPLGFIVFLSESGGVDGATAIRVVIGGGIIIGLIVGIFTLIASIQGRSESTNCGYFKNTDYKHTNTVEASKCGMRSNSVTPGAILWHGYHLSQISQSSSSFHAL